MFKFKCKCGQIYNATEKHCGKEFSCKACQKILYVPTFTHEEQDYIQPEIKDDLDQNNTKVNGNVPNSNEKILTTIQSVDFKNNNIINSTKAIFNDFAEIDFKTEIIPIDESNLKVLLNDYTFWSALFLGVVPILILTTQNDNFQQTSFAMFFASIWGVIFKKFILDDHGSWKAPIISFFFTGMIGIPVLLIVYSFLPSFFMDLTQSNALIVKYIGFIFRVGICEELIKMLPIFLFLLFNKSNVDPLKLLIIGIFSGLGFAAFENIMYNLSLITTSAALAMKYGTEGAIIGTHQAIVSSITRYLSTVFGHAIYSGIFSYFIATIYISCKRKTALFILGLFLASIIHGTYDWLIFLQPTFAGFTNAISFVLLYGYIIKLKSMVEVSNKSFEI